MLRTSSLLRRSALVTGVAGLAIFSLGVSQGLAFGAQPAGKKPTINTYGSWDGASYVGSFGCPNTTTYGQVITIPAKKNHLNKFIFYMNDFGASGSMVARGEVYGWDGSKATTAIAETSPKTLSFGDSTVHKVAFNAGGAAVTPGQQVVIFASIDKDYEECTQSGYSNAWADMSDTVYTEGTFVFENNGGDESQWTQPVWTTTWGVDLAFKAYLSK